MVFLTFRLGEVFRYVLSDSEVVETGDMQDVGCDHCSDWELVNLLFPSSSSMGAKQAVWLVGTFVGMVWEELFITRGPGLRKEPFFGAGWRSSLGCPWVSFQGLLCMRLYRLYRLYMALIAFEFSRWRELVMIKMVVFSSMVRSSWGELVMTNMVVVTI